MDAPGRDAPSNRGLQRTRSSSSKKPQKPTICSERCSRGCSWRRTSSPSILTLKHLHNFIDGAALHPGTNVTSSSVNALTRLVPCATKPGPDKWMWRVTFTCVDPSCTDCIEPRFVQVALRHFVVDLQPSKEFQLFRDSANHQLWIQLTRRSKLRQMYTQPTVLDTPLRTSVQLPQRRSLHRVHCQTDRWRFAILHASGQPFNNRIALRQECAQLLRRRHSNSRYSNCDEHLHSKYIASARLANCTLPSTVPNDLLHQQARVYTSAASGPWIVIPRRLDTLVIQQQALTSRCASTQQKFGAHLIVQVPATARHVEDRISSAVACLLAIVLNAQPSPVPFSVRTE